MNRAETEALIDRLDFEIMLATLELTTFGGDERLLRKLANARDRATKLKALARAELDGQGPA